MIRKLYLFAVWGSYGTVEAPPSCSAAFVVPMNNNVAPQPLQLYSTRNYWSVDGFTPETPGAARRTIRSRENPLPFWPQSAHAVILTWLYHMNKMGVSFGFQALTLCALTSFSRSSYTNLKKKLPLRCYC